MIRALIEARRRAKSFRDIDQQLARLRLGMTEYERQEEARRKHAADAALLALLAVTGALVMFGMLDPIFETIDHLLKAIW